MKFWTVQCCYPAYYANTVTVEAETLEDALEKAIEEANDDDRWKSVDDCGPTFVAAVAEGEDVDPWKGYASSTAVPPRFTEQGEPPVVTVTVSAGVVQDVTVENGAVRVRVHDYDTDGADPNDPNIHTDEKGHAYALAQWDHEIPPREAADHPR